ncbi:ABC transporter permease [Corallococcus sp. H22C18031201]|nr:ABC transporter permease [Corallococcus sp. H22C18031201]
MAPSAQATPPAPSEPWWARWGDRLNPLVVKEVRQGLRTRVFWICFALMLLACLALSLVAYLDLRNSAVSQQGSSFFFAFFFCLAVVHFFIVPYSAYRSLAREREDETWVLLVLTGLGPRRILRGKVASYLVQGALYASAAGPFLLFSYYLNGIDLFTILLVLGLAAAWLVFVTMVAVCAATLADSRVGRAFVHFALLGGLGISLVTALTSAYGMIEHTGRWMGDTEFFIGVGICLWGMLSYGWLLFEASAARLALPTENYTLEPRRAVVLQSTLSLLVALCAWQLKDQSFHAASFTGVMGMVHLAGIGVILASDADGQARALRAATRPWSLYRPGAVRGFRLALVLQAGWTAVCFVMVQASVAAESTLAGFSRALVSMLFYSVLYLSVSLLLSRLVPQERFSRSASVRLVFFCVVALGGAVPPVLASLLDLSSDAPLFNVLNPFMGPVNFAESRYRDALPDSMLACVGLLAVLAAFCADRSLVQRERRVHAS